MKLPIGLQDFATLRQGGYLYVDKTRQIFNILRQGKYYFLSRPRRFGKSLLLSTIHELYRGNREVFEGLWVDEHWDWEADKRPVIWLKFARLDYQQKGLYQALRDELERIAADRGIAQDAGATVKDAFSHLIRELARHDGRVVLLVDEYDKPIIDYLDAPERADEHRNVLKSFYSVLKDHDADLELVLITGVSAFSQVSIFSDLNNLSPLTLNPLAYDLIGITQAELEDRLLPLRPGVDKEAVRTWYNGYSWGGEEKLYNPFSVLSYFRDGQFHNHWFQTGTPTFLVKEMRQQRYYDAFPTMASATGLLSFDYRNLDPVAVLFQAGYLTVTEVHEGGSIYTLDYPNREVRQSLEQLLLGLYTHDAPARVLPRIFQLRNALNKRDLDTAIRIIDASFASIPYDLWHRDDEHFFHAIVHLTFSLLGTYVRSEVHSAGGRADAIVELDDYIYSFEFKRDGTAEEALQQIRDKGYLVPYADDARQKLAVGIGFDVERKRVGEWDVARYIR